MRIERERFLLVVAALGSGASLAPACSPAPTPEPQSARSETPQTVAVTIPPQPVETASAAPPRAPDPPPPASASPAPSSSSPTATPTAAPSTAASAAAKPPNPYDGTPVTAQACAPALNARGTAPRCALTPPGPSCESFSDTKSECPKLATLFKPRVAQAAIECLNRKSGTKEICEFNVSSICAYEALGSACLDPAAKATCDGVVARCGKGGGRYNKMSRESCEAGVSGVADAKRARFVACITESCRFETCLTYM